MVVRNAPPCLANLAFTVATQGFLLASHTVSHIIPVQR